MQNKLAGVCECFLLLLRLFSVRTNVLCPAQRKPSEALPSAVVTRRMVVMTMTGTDRKWGLYDYVTRVVIQKYQPAHGHAFLDLWILIWLGGKPGEGNKDEIINANLCTGGCLVFGPSFVKVDACWSSWSTSIEEIEVFRTNSCSAQSSAVDTEETLDKTEFCAKIDQRSSLVPCNKTDCSFLWLWPPSI